ncbi:Hsp20/alpha crystallin family protein [Natrarchaeobaculum aegyptiacum]|uniref:ArsA HSP20-like domain-containing protein n=1 Tax=Natrarchaeobaculum aegyptiacum TaxID=745377 RepID=A0A2Z2HSR6_9EURY|nr:Hsp20/alpha crystallin family protein [Natrarchaeobaculum aegyptiacum]ARS88447.1 hypothetical protein B1756_00890 [Natrarchaeobaculum aegyptiacum]
MSDVPTDDDRDPDRDRDADDQFDTDWLSSLRAVLEALENGPLATRGSRDSPDGRRSLEFGISIGSIEDALSDVGVDERRGPGRTPAGPGGGGPRDSTDSRRRSTSRGVDRDDDYAVTTRESDDELYVVADLVGVDPEDVTVGFDDSRLVVAVAGAEVERVAIPWESRDATASFKNGVLTVRIDRQQGDDR